LFQPLNPRRDKFVVHSAIRPFRHAGNTFKLQVMDVRDTVVAEFDIVDPSPTAGQYPTWAPDELPVTQSDGDVSVTLTDLTARNSTSGLESRSTAAVDVTPIFRVTQNGLPTTQWTRSRSTIYDALGNESQLYGCELCPEESAWKLKMRVFRNEHAAFDPSEQWTVGGVELPTTETKKLNYESRLQDVTISLLALGQSGRVSHYGLAQSSSGSWSYSGDISSGSMGKQHLAEIRTTSQGSSSTTTVQCDIPHLIARVSNQTVDHDAPLLMVIDDKGQRINVSSPINHIDNTQIWFLEIPDDAGSLQLTFNVQRARVFEFTVKPPRVEPTEPPLRSDAGNH
jgi:hypothetical protein